MRTENRRQKSNVECWASNVGRRTLDIGHRRFAWILGCGALFVVWSASSAFAGNLDSPAAPSDDSGRMYTLEQIYQKVLSGTTPTKQSGGFNEPAAGPASTMHTLDDIEAKIAAGTTTATPGDVLDGKTFITRTGGSGESMLTGSITTQTLSAENDTVNAGYYAATTLSAVDTDLAAGNIKNGITIFGVLGTYTGTGGSAGVPKTGQTTSYVDYDDGYYEKGLPTSGTHWTDNGDGTITDNATGLMWVKSGYADTNTFPATPYTPDGNWRRYTWANAILYCERLEFAGYTDWRLPNVKELQSIVNYARHRPAIGESSSESPWTNTRSGRYWSSTTNASGTGYAWVVNFNGGNVVSYNKANTGYVRPVRGGQ